MTAHSSRLGHAIRTWRASQGLGQAALGELVGVSRQSVSLWETGQVTPYPTQLERLKRLMGAAYPTLGDLPSIPIEQVLDAAKAALDAWWLEYRAQLIAAAYDAPPDAPALPDGSGHIEATAARELLSRSAAPPAPAAQDAAPTRRRK